MANPSYRYLPEDKTNHSFWSTYAEKKALQLKSKKEGRSQTELFREWCRSLDTYSPPQD